MTADRGPRGPRDRKYDRINIALLVITGGAQLALLTLASRLAPWHADQQGLQGNPPFELVLWILCLIAFATIAALTVSSLVHESLHDHFHSNPRWNARFGVLMCWFFPGAYTLQRRSHETHHCFNRTDFEKFDLYDEDDVLWLKYVQWYGVLGFGLYALAIPLFSVGLAVAPWMFRRGPAIKAKTTGPLFSSDFFTASTLARIRLEVIGGALFWIGASVSLGLDLATVAIFVGAHWWNWSTRQLIGHSFSPRDVVQGGHNLGVTTFHRWLLLNLNYELIHHQFPSARWQDFHQLRNQSRPTVGYWGQYFRLWRGPIPNTEAAPTPLANTGGAP